MNIHNMMQFCFTLCSKWLYTHARSRTHHCRTVRSMMSRRLRSSLLRLNTSTGTLTLHVVDWWWPNELCDEIRRKRRGIISTAFPLASRGLSATGPHWKCKPYIL